MFEVAPIVEGYGDVDAVPALLRRLLPTAAIKRPVRFPKSMLQEERHLTRAAGIADSNIRSRGAVILVLDADKDCAKTLGPQLLSGLSRALPGRICRVAVAVREFESWIRGGLPGFTMPDADAAGKPKDWLREQFGRYAETADQARLISEADLELLATRSRSFRHLRHVCEELKEMIAAP